MFKCLSVSDKFFFPLEIIVKKLLVILKYELITGQRFPGRKLSINHRLLAEVIAYIMHVINFVRVRFLSRYGHYAGRGPHGSTLTNLIKETGNKIAYRTIDNRICRLL